MATYPQTFEEFKDELDKLLHGNNLGILKDVFIKIERDLQVPRLNVVLVFLVCLTLLFLATDVAHFLCNFICFAIPACIIVWNIEQGQTQLNTKKWVTYWVIYNMFIFVEYFLWLESSIFYIRLYWLLKCILLCGCFLPVQWNGSERLYDTHISSLLQTHQTSINLYFSWLWESTNTGLPVFVFLYGAYTWGFRFLCNILSFLYPAYISMVSLTKEPELDRMIWLTYWVVYSGLNFAEYILSIIPLYYLIKFVVVGIYLLEPLAQEALYHVGQSLILRHKPMNAASIYVHNIVYFFLTSRPTMHNIHIRQGRLSPGVFCHQNMALKSRTTLLKAQKPVLNQTEVEFLMSSPIVKAVLEMNVEVEMVKKAIILKLAKDGPGHNFKSAEDLLEAIFDLPASSESEEKDIALEEFGDENGIGNSLSIPHSHGFDGDKQAPMEVIEENRQLKEQLLCKICMTEDVETAFVPCGHLVCCFHCACKVDKCPICRMEIESALRTYMS